MSSAVARIAARERSRGRRALAILGLLALIASAGAFVAMGRKASPESANRYWLLGVSFGATAAALLSLAALGERRKPFRELLRRSETGRAVLSLAVAGALAIFACYPWIAESARGKLGKVAWLIGALLIALGLVAWALAAWLSAEPKGKAASFVDVALFNAALALLLLEGALRLAGAFSSSPLFLPRGASLMADAEYVKSWLLRPGEIYHGSPANSQGFYDDEFARPKPADVFRIVALADSFGVGVVPRRHNFLTLLESELAGWAGDKRVEVCNLGVRGIGPEHYLALLAREGKALEPDLVLVCPFAGNDFAGQPSGDAFASRWDVFMTWRVLARVVRVWRAQAKLAAEGAPTDGAAGADMASSEADPPHILDWRLEQPTLPREEYLRIQLGRSLYFQPAAGEEPFRQRLPYLLEMNALARNLTGKPAVFALLPDEMQINPEHRRVMEGLARTRLDLEMPWRFLSRELEGDGAIALDLAPALREGQGTLGRVYHLQDTHWNANGNRIAAQEIARQLRERPDLAERARKKE
jgi:hypothetical protein